MSDGNGNGRVAGKVAVVSGASSGIGRATFELLGREGAKVVGTARTESKLQEALDAIKADGGEGIIVPADLEDPATADKVVKAAIDEYGRIDILVCNAGVGWKYGEEHPGTMAGVHEADVQNWRDVIGGVDLEGYFTMIHAALPKMLEQESGSIVSVASMAGLTGLYDAHAYTAAKGAIINLTRSMGITYAKQGVRANCVCPGFDRHADDRTGDRRFQRSGDEMGDGADGPRRPSRGDGLRRSLPGLRRGELLHRHGALGRRRLHFTLVPDGLNGCVRCHLDQLTIGDAAESRKTISESDVYLFAGVTGDFNPLHVDAEYAKTTPFGARVAHGPLTFSLCAGLLGTELPGLGTVAVSNQITYEAPVFIGDTIAVRVEVAELDPERNRATVAVTWRNQDGTQVASGSMVVKPPREPVSLS